MRNKSIEFLRKDAARVRKWYRKNRKAILERSREQYQRNKKRKLSKAAIWSKKNWARHKASMDAWRWRNPEKMRKARLRLRVIRKDAIYIEHDVPMPKNKRCPYCNVKMNSKWPASNAPVIDHIKPIARGGHHVPGNTMIICNRCNLIKGNRSVKYLKKRLLLDAPTRIEASGSNHTPNPNGEHHVKRSVACRACEED